MDDKTNIIIASILKPIDDTRAYEKIGQSLAQTNKYAVNIIGFESKKTKSSENISFWPIFNGKRNHIKRVLIPFKCLKIFIQVKPKVIIVNTPELLLVSYLYKIIFGAKIIYDIIENYQMNLSFDTIYAKWQKPLLHLYLFIVEGISRFFVSHYFLAERVYQEQLKFIQKSAYSIIENKAAIPANANKNSNITLDRSQALVFIITGTLGKSYGTLEGIDFFKSISKEIPNSRLKVIGFAADIAYKKKIMNKCDEEVNIDLEIAEGPIQHSLIIKEIKRAHIALLPYQINDNLRFRIPTKIYEYLALRIPMLIPENKIWSDLIDKYQAGHTINFKSKKTKAICLNIFNGTYYTAVNDTEIYWSKEVSKLLDALKNIS